MFFTQGTSRSLPQFANGRRDATPRPGCSSQVEYRTSPAGRAGLKRPKIYLMCPETSLVISNMLTWLLPLNTGLSESSALIMVRFFLSWHPFFLM
jgi:hypothetical protein